MYRHDFSLLAYFLLYFIYLFKNITQPSNWNELKDEINAYGKDFSVKKHQDVLEQQTVRNAPVQKHLAPPPFFLSAHLEALGCRDTKGQHALRCRKRSHMRWISSTFRHWTRVHGPLEQPTSIQYMTCCQHQSVLSHIMSHLEPCCTLYLHHLSAPLHLLCKGTRSRAHTHTHRLHKLHAWMIVFFVVRH